MSAGALQRVVVRMLHDPALVEAVYADAGKALARVELSAAERGWLTAPDRRRWGADPLRRSRGLQAVLEEFPVAGAVAARAQGLGALDGFFSAPAFHRCVQGGGSLALAFGEWLARFGGAVAAFAALEGGVARVRRAPPRPAEAPAVDRARSWVAAPWVWGVRAPGGTLAAWTAHRARLAAHPGGMLAGLVEPGYALEKRRLVKSAPEGLLVERTGAGVDEIGVAAASLGLAGLLEALRTPQPWATVAATMRRLGAARGEEAGLAAELLGDGLLTVR